MLLCFLEHNKIGGHAGDHFCQLIMFLPETTHNESRMNNSSTLYLTGWRMSPPWETDRGFHKVTAELLPSSRREQHRSPGTSLLPAPRASRLRSLFWLERLTECAKDTRKTLHKICQNGYELNIRLRKRRGIFSDSQWRQQS